MQSIPGLLARAIADKLVLMILLERT